MAGIRRRSTKRKVIVNQVIEDKGRPVLLDELRWAVFLQEHARHHGRDGSNFVIPMAYCKSFNRTIRDHMAGLVVSKLKRPERFPRGIVARTAVYRLESIGDIRAFTSDKAARLYVYWTSNDVGGGGPPDGGRLMSRIKCSLYVGKQNRRVPTRKIPTTWLLGETKPYTIKFIPANRPLLVVGKSRLREEDVLEIANVPWVANWKKPTRQKRGGKKWQSLIDPPMLPDGS